MAFGGATGGVPAPPVTAESAVSRATRARRCGADWSRRAARPGVSVASGGSRRPTVTAQVADPAPASVGPAGPTASPAITAATAASAAMRARILPGTGRASQPTEARVRTSR